MLSEINEASDDGVSTSKSITLEYDHTTWNLTKKHGLSNNKYFEQNFDYDQYGSLVNNNEVFESKVFYTNGRTYDTFGRLINYSKGISSNGTSTETTIENRYNTWDGSLLQLKEASTGKILWSLNSTNAKGQVLNANLGTAKIFNSYDDYGFLTNTDRYFYPTLQGYPSQSFININYSFNAIKNELNSRTYQAVFNIDEKSFEYDDNNRLARWTNPITGQMSSSTFDHRGRITFNEQVGDVEFNGGNSLYQATNMQLNTDGEHLYDMNNGASKLFQMISYNENNDPIRIDGTESDYEFKYGLSNARQIMNFGSQFNEGDEGKFVKYYSEDNDFEILYDTGTGNEKHIIYIGGSPYESEIVYIKPFKDEARFNFLHKDYLGSILAITDFDKNILEQRHFDAWGNFTHLKVGGNEYIGDDLKSFLKTQVERYGGLIVDRGYTSHEHLYGVELIHMNGRLYDSHLQRFLNADENIQDPYNTQNYNKYGYVMNNPLMYNDPSGEFVPFAIFAGMGAFWGSVASAAVLGAAIGAGMYALSAMYMGNFSWGAFGKALFTGFYTGAVSSGLGQVFNAANFWATVGNGALAGAGSGGVTSLINGTNFLEGLSKGAVIGGAVAGISWQINSMVSPPSDKTVDVLDDAENVTGDPVVQSSKKVKEVMRTNFRGKNSTSGSVTVLHKEGDLPNYLKKQDYKFDGKTLLNDKGEKVLATTTPFYGNKYMRYVFAPNAFRSSELLTLTTGHELFHGVLFSHGYKALELSMGSWYQGKYVNSHHAIIAEWERQYIKIRGWQNLNLPLEPLYDFTTLRTYNLDFNSRFKGMMDLMNEFLK